MEFGERGEPVSLNQQTEKTQTTRPVLCIVGPTGVGKSDVAVAVARAVGGEVVSADSMQVYRGMDVGTAKLTPEQMQGVPHHCIDLVDPRDSFTVADWTRHADQAIAAIHARGRLPIVAGGTGLYIRAIVEDLDFAQRAASTAVREQWEQYVAHHGAQALHERLIEVDPVSATRLHPNDIRRVMRALEVAQVGEQPLSATYDWTPKGGRYATWQVGLTMGRAALYTRLDARVDTMVAAGLEAEVRQLLGAGCDSTQGALQAIGYKEWVACLDGQYTREQAIVKIKQATRRFAKRQLSWFLRDQRIDWIELEGAGHVPEHRLQRVCEQARQLLAGIQPAGLEYP